MNVLYILAYRLCTGFIRFITKYFEFMDATVNSIFIKFLNFQVLIANI